MTGTQLASYIRARTYTDSTSFTDDQILLLTNIIKDEMASQITQAFEDIFLISTTDSLVAGQRKYLLPADYIKIKQIEANLNEEWVKLAPFDINNYRRPTNEENILKNFAIPQYDLFNGSFKI